MEISKLVRNYHVQFVGLYISLLTTRKYL